MLFSAAVVGSESNPTCFEKCVLKCGGYWFDSNAGRALANPGSIISGETKDGVCMCKPYKHADPAKPLGQTCT